MKVMCKKSSGNYSFFVIPYELESDKEDVASSEGATSDTGELNYDLTPECDYITYGIVVLDGEVRYLLQDDRGYPGFFPCGLFEVLKSALPLDWEIAEYHLHGKVMLVIGYSDLVNKYSHLRGILLAEPHDIKVFLEEKERMMNMFL